MIRYHKCQSTSGKEDSLLISPRISIVFSRDASTPSLGVSSIYCLSVSNMQFFGIGRFTRGGLIKIAPFLLMKLNYLFTPQVPPLPSTPSPGFHFPHGPGPYGALAPGPSCGPLQWTLKYDDGRQAGRLLGQLSALQAVAAERSLT